MAFGKNKDEVFQRVATVTDDPKPVKKKKSKEVEEAVPAPDTTMWSTGGGDRPQHFEAAPAKAAPTAAPVAEQPPAQSSAPEQSSSVREVGSTAQPVQPRIEYSLVDEGEITGGMYSDSGRTVTMAMRIISYLLYICAPIYFIGKIFLLIGTDSKQLTTGFAVSTVADGIVGAVLLAGGGILVVALIKILQNLMALQKKKKRK